MALARRQWLAAARSGRAVPATVDQGGREAGRRSAQGGLAASGRAVMASRLAQGRHAACAGGAAGRPRRRGGVPAAVAPESKGERDREHE